MDQDLSLTITIIVDILENLAHAVQAHPHGQLSVTSELVEPVVTEIHRHQRHVGVVHGLQLDAWERRI